jgi:hypothetical protein
MLWLIFSGPFMEVRLRLVSGDLTVTDEATVMPSREARERAVGDSAVKLPPKVRLLKVKFVTGEMES